MNSSLTLESNWLAAEEHVRVEVSLRTGGVSEAPYDSLNLGDHVGDILSQVTRNRELYLAELSGAESIQWLQQEHGTDVFRVDKEHASRLGSEVKESQKGGEKLQGSPPCADALYTRERGVALVVLTADCLPVCFSNRDGSEIAIAHAGWKGLVSGVLDNTVETFISRPEELLAWFGPAIGPCHFEVGNEVRSMFLDAMPRNDLKALIDEAFEPGEKSGKWMADLYALARIRLQALGVTNVSGGGACTVCEHDKFFSYRRNNPTGRFATSICLS